MNTLNSWETKNFPFLIDSSLKLGCVTMGVTGALRCKGMAKCHWGLKERTSLLEGKALPSQLYKNGLISFLRTLVLCRDDS